MLPIRAIYYINTGLLRPEEKSAELLDRLLVKTGVFARGNALPFNKTDITGLACPGARI
jgi:hypothetical protein